MRINRWVGAVLILVLFPKAGLSQQLRLGNYPWTVEKSAVLELQSTNQGLLFTRIADTALINALNPPDGMVVYFTPFKRLLLRANGHWQSLASTTSIDTSNIPGFYMKVRSEFTAGTGISYNNTTGVISNSGVTALNGNTGVLTMDTGYISNFYQKVRGLFSAGSGITYNATTGVITASGGANNAFLYSTGNDFVIGNSTSAKNVRFFTGGTATTNERMRIDGTGNLGIATTAPTSKLDVNGSAALGITTTNTNLTLDETNYSVIITGGTPTITLPAASTCVRRMYVIVNQTVFSRTISAYRNFSNASTTTVPATSSITIQSDGTNWYRIQ